MMLLFTGCGTTGYLTLEGRKDARVEKSRVDEFGMFGGSTGEEGATSPVGGHDSPLMEARITSVQTITTASHIQ
jgi:hypothetical protein